MSKTIGRTGISGQQGTGASQTDVIGLWLRGLRVQSPSLTPSSGNTSEVVEIANARLSRELDAYKARPDDVRLELALAEYLSAVETWRSAPGFEGWYEVSDQGRVRRIRKSDGSKCCRMLVSSLTAQGYLVVSLCGGENGRTVTVHSLVARAFVGAQPDGHQVNHRDGNKANAAAANLEWVTPKDNVRHAKRSGLSGVRSLRRHPLRAALIPFFHLSGVMS